MYPDAEGRYSLPKSLPVHLNSTKSTWNPKITFRVLCLQGLTLVPSFTGTFNYRRKSSVFQSFFGPVVSGTMQWFSSEKISI